MIQRTFILSLFLVLSSGVSASAEETDLFIRTPDSKGAVLVLHGFNVRPSKMDTLAKSIASWGYDVYRPALSGHRGVFGDMRKASAFNWIEETWSAIRTLSIISKGKPVYFVGVSMAGLILNEVIKKHPEAQNIVRKSVLISPAFTFGIYALSPRYLILHDSYPLMSPSKDWDLDFVSLGAYRTLLALYDQAHANKLSRLNLPSLVLLHPDDKIINPQDVPELKQEYGMTQWQLVTFPNDTNQADNPNNHLLVDEKTAGPHAWQTLLNRTKLFLDN